MERSAKWIQLGKAILLGLVLTVFAAGLGLYLGNLVISPQWQDAIRLAGLGSVVVAILVNPALGLMLWIILEPFTRFWFLSIRLPPGIPDLSLGRLSVGLLTAVWLAQLASGKRRMRRLSLVEISMAAFCIMALPSVMAGMGGFSRSGQQMFDRFIAPFLAFILAKNLYDKKTGLDRLGAMLTVIGLYLSFMVFYEQITGQPLFYLFGRTTAYSRSLRKIVSLLGNPAFLGTVLGMVVPFALYKFVRERSMAKLLYGLLFAVAALGNFLCFNRGAWLALAMALLLMMVFAREYRRYLLPVILIAAIIGVLRWQAISESPLVTERLINVSGVRFRLTMLEASQKMIREHLLFGVGFENFGYYYLLYGGHWETLAYDVPTPHNSYLLVFTTMGLVCFIPYVLIFLSMFVQIGTMLRRAGRDTRIDKALLVAGWAVIAVYTVSAASVDLFINFFTSLVFFVIMGTIMGYVSQLRSSAPLTAPVPGGAAGPWPSGSVPSSLPEARP